MTIKIQKQERSTPKERNWFAAISWLAIIPMIIVFNILQNFLESFGVSKPLAMLSAVSILMPIFYWINPKVKVSLKNFFIAGELLFIVFIFGVYFLIPFLKPYIHASFAYGVVILLISLSSYFYLKFINPEDISRFSFAQWSLGSFFLASLPVLVWAISSSGK
jgi:hypothetical protein